MSATAPGRLERVTRARAPVLSATDPSGRGSRYDAWACPANLQTERRHARTAILIKSFTVAVVGATGLVGQTMTHLLLEGQFPVGDFRPAASRADGRTVEFGGRHVDALKGFRRRLSNGHVAAAEFDRAAIGARGKRAKVPTGTRAQAGSGVMVWPTRPVAPTTATVSDRRTVLRTWQRSVFGYRGTRRAS